MLVSITMDIFSFNTDNIIDWKSQGSMKILIRQQ